MGRASIPGIRELRPRQDPSEGGPLTGGEIPGTGDPSRTSSVTSGSKQPSCSPLTSSLSFVLVVVRYVEHANYPYWQSDWERHFEHIKHWGSATANWWTKTWLGLQQYHWCNDMRASRHYLEDRLHNILRLH